MLIAALLAGVINLLSIDFPIWSKTQLAIRSDGQRATTQVVRNPYYYKIGRSDVVSDIGLRHRLLIAERAIEDWRNRPVLGIGLGGFLWSHRSPDDPLRGLQIHATALWLLVETGIVGLTLFAAFFVAVMRALLWRYGKWEKDPVLIGIAAALIVVGVASIGTEILYQRYLWFLAGLGLAWPGPIGTSAAETVAPRSKLELEDTNG